MTDHMYDLRVELKVHFPKRKVLLKEIQGMSCLCPQSIACAPIFCGEIVTFITLYLHLFECSVLRFEQNFVVSKLQLSEHMIAKIT